MKISVRQICFIMIAYTVVGKLLIYPTQLANFCGRDILFPALFDLFISGVIIWSLAFLCSKTDKTFFELLQATIGKIGARIVYGFFAAYFIAAALIPIFEQKLYVHTIFYDTVPSLMVFLPFFMFSLYAASKRFLNIGRCADICLPVFAVTMASVFLMSFSEAKWDNLLPILTTPAQKVFSSAANTAFRFTEPCWLLMFMGHFRYKKGDAAKITLSYALGAAVEILVLPVFYSVFGEILSSRTFAVSRTSIYFPAIETLGRIDLILLYALEMVMLFAVVLDIQMAVHSLALCTGYDDRRVWSLAVNGVLIVILIVCDHYFHSILQFFSQWAWIWVLLFAALVPLALWILYAVVRRREYERKI